MESNSKIAPATELHAALTALTASGADCFNPVRFRYIQTMANRSLQQDTTVAQLLLAKTWAALRDYQSTFSKEHTQIATLVEHLVSLHPDTADHLQCLFEACEFKAIRHLAQRRLKAIPSDSFASLTHQLDAGETYTAGPQQAGVISGTLQSAQPEKWPVTQVSVSGNNASTTSHRRELKAVRYFRDTLQQEHADKLVTHALKDAPESAGPLNPQKLALRSLAIMREISPSYLGRYVSYLNTVFWLEELNEETGSK